MIEGLLSLLMFVFILWFVLWFVIWICIQLPADMARSRGRSAVGWVIFGLMTNPLFACFVLWLIGDSGRARGQR